MVDAYTNSEDKKDSKRSKQDWLARAAAEAGYEMPEDTLDPDAPELRDDLRFYLVAFNKLSTVRPASFGGVMPLPYDKVLDYAERCKLDPEEVEEFCEIIESLDSEFRKFLNAETDKPVTNNDGTRNKSDDRPGNVGGVKKG